MNDREVLQRIDRAETALMELSAAVEKIKMEFICLPELIAGTKYELSRCKELLNAND